MTTPQEAHRRAKPGQFVIGWLLEPAQRGELLARFPPAYERVVAHHVTLKPRVARGSVLPHAVRGEIVGVSDDGQGVQALVVRLHGSTERPGGGTYHVTWSLAEGRKAKESNDLIAAHGWKAIEPPVPVDLVPACFP